MVSMSGGVYRVWGAGGTRVCLEAIPNPSEEGGVTLSCSFGEA